jgi:hypothetical protein
VTIDGTVCVAKHLRAGGDWLMRATGDFGLRELALSERGVLARLPATIDHAVIATAREGDRGVLLMRDVSTALFRDDDEPLDAGAHAAYVDGLAALHAAMWEWDDDIGLLGTAHRYLMFRPQLAEHEAERGGGSPIPGLIAQGWERYATRAPRSYPVIRALLDDPTPLVRALDATPSTLLHGDTKCANAGLHADGRIVLIDWAFAGRGPACADLAWHLSLNRARFPEPKEAVIARYRDALEREGIETAPWWDRQLALCLLGGVVQMGWEKALGDGDELAWWDDHAAAAARSLQ